MSAWDGIDEFVSVANAGTFTAGAEAMNVSTTHMSRAISRLETRIQAQLFHRTTRTVRLTDAGRIFLDHCRRIISERDEAIAQMSEKGEPRGELRITCSTAMGERFIAPIVRDFAAGYPQLSVTINLTNRVLDLIGEGHDLAIRTGFLADSRLIGTRIASRSVYTCASPDYLDRAGRPESVKDLDDHECLTGSSATWRFSLGVETILHQPKGRWRCNSGAAVLDAALAGMGICQLPEFYVLPYIASGALIEIMEKERPEEEPIWAVYPQRRHLLPKVSGIVQKLRTELPAAITGASNAQSAAR